MTSNILVSAQTFAVSQFKMGESQDLARSKTPETLMTPYDFVLPGLISGDYLNLKRTDIITPIKDLASPKIQEETLADKVLTSFKQAVGGSTPSKVQSLPAEAGEPEYVGLGKPPVPALSTPKVLNKMTLDIFDQQSLQDQEKAKKDKFKQEKKPEVVKPNAADTASSQPAKTKQKSIYEEFAEKNGTMTAVPKEPKGVVVPIKEVGKFSKIPAAISQAPAQIVPGSPTTPKIEHLAMKAQEVQKTAPVVTKQPTNQAQQLQVSAEVSTFNLSAIVGKDLVMPDISENAYSAAQKKAQKDKEAQSEEIENRSKEIQCRRNAKQKRRLPKGTYINNDMQPEQPEQVQFNRLGEVIKPKRKVTITEVVTKSQTKAAIVERPAKKKLSFSILAWLFSWLFGSRKK